MLYFWKCVIFTRKFVKFLVLKKWWFLKSKQWNTQQYFIFTAKNGNFHSNYENRITAFTMSIGCILGFAWLHAPPFKYMLIVGLTSRPFHGFLWPLETQYGLDPIWVGPHMGWPQYGLASIWVRRIWPMRIRHAHSIIEITEYQKIILNIIIWFLPNLKLGEIEPENKRRVSIISR